MSWRKRYLAPIWAYLLRFSGALALALGVVFWTALARASNSLVNQIMGDYLDKRWMRWEGAIVLVVTLLAAWWAALRVVNPPEKFD
jgi:Mn2+/Fe2+ NRAMP family transporter